MKKAVQIFLPIVIFLSACSSQTLTLTPVTEISYTSVLAPTSTKQPTETQAPTLPSNQISLTSTIEALNNDCNTLGHEFSPDKKWVAIKCDNGKINISDELNTTLKIVNVKTLQEWIVSYHQIYGAKEIESLGWMSEGTIFPTNWSADGIYLYIGVMPQVFREFHFNRTAALFRLNLVTGEITEVLDTGTVQETFYDYSLSPDEKRIAFVKLLESPLKLNIMELDTGKFQSVSLDPRFTSAGSVVWSQDNSSLIFLAIDFNEKEPTSTTLFRWHPQSEKLIQESQLLDRLFFILKWDEEKNSVLIRDYYEEILFELDFTTDELIPVSQ